VVLMAGLAPFKLSADPFKLSADVALEAAHDLAFGAAQSRHN
jgi:hypothetical protein